MGGTGSGRWGPPRQEADRGRVLGVGHFRGGPGRRVASSTATSWSLRPITPTIGKRMSPVRCTVESGEDGAPLLRLSYEVPGRWASEYQVEESIGMQTTRPNYGGER